MEAGKIIELKSLRLINEPTAAAIAYGFDKNYNENANIIIYNLGGGVFDVSLIKLDEGIHEVEATNGDTHLGGRDFDERFVFLFNTDRKKEGVPTRLKLFGINFFFFFFLERGQERGEEGGGVTKAKFCHVECVINSVMTYFINQFKHKHNVDLRQNSRAIAKLRRECEKAKHALSTATQVKVEIENLVDGIDLSETLTRTIFEELNYDLFKKTITLLDTLLKNSKLNKSDIHQIVLVGGSTRIPKIQQMVKEYFNGNEVHCDTNPDEVVAFGAAVHGAAVSGQASDTLKKLLVIDVVQLSLGIETLGGVMTKIIEKNSPIPIRRTQVFSTYHHGQSTISIRVYQGERAMAADNRLLGIFNITGISPTPPGVPQIEVVFEIDANGILHVNAFDKFIGDIRGITITTDKGRPTQEEIDAMLKSAAQSAKEDNKFRNTIEARNDLESAVYHLKNEVDDVILWLQKNTDAELAHYKHQQEAFGSNVKSILNNLFRQRDCRAKAVN
ncbi:hypothetical protein RFI_30891 [Reticulomyxa filosa]|uniref:Heat shock protein 70 n=1 Tax=Reticulomyxa filosa TaxID=46433 RepID=X6LYS6_RETFI|nr:hypothetical protein RFI_30891 [Reticulomyxa filosa]|eukprot:ETO06501.1 hypothetical protein RFI_30891 [Reticulomyxa filosa]